MSKIIKTINLTEADISTMDSLLRQSTVEARMYIRAKILLLKYDEYTYEQIDDKPDVCLSAVMSYVQRFLYGVLMRLCITEKDAGANLKLL